MGGEESSLPEKVYIGVGISQSPDHGCVCTWEEERNKYTIVRELRAATWQGRRKGQSVAINSLPSTENFLVCGSPCLV